MTMGDTIENPPVPYLGYIPNGVFVNRRVTVKGQLNPCAHSIEINLKHGPAPCDDIAFHLSFSFAHNMITRNARFLTCWGTEMKNGPIQMEKSQPFEIAIVAEGQGFGVYLNGKQLLPTFSYRSQELCKICYLEVEGDMTISSIQYDKAIHFFDTKTTIIAAAVMISGMITILLIGFGFHLHWFEDASKILGNKHDHDHDHHNRDEYNQTTQPI